jgi:hypothetical protein
MKDIKKDVRVLNYKRGRFALIDLPSGERIFISIGSATARVVDKSSFIRWCFTKCVVSERLDKWQPEYWRSNSFYRGINRAMILDGLLISLLKCNSINEIRQIWPTLENPILVFDAQTRK